MEDEKIRLSLAIVRITTALFFLIWSIEKIIAPQIAQGVFEKFYGLEITPTVSTIIGVIQTLIVLGLLAGLFKTFTYGMLLGMHTVSVLSTYQQLINPYQPPNHLFWAGVPVLGALIALFLLRENDTLFTLNGFND